VGLFVSAPAAATVVVDITLARESGLAAPPDAVVGLYRPRNLERFVGGSVPSGSVVVEALGTLLSVGRCVREVLRLSRSL